MDIGLGSWTNPDLYWHALQRVNVVEVLVRQSCHQRLSRLPFRCKRSLQHSDAGHLNAGGCEVNEASYNTKKTTIPDEVTLIAIAMARQTIMRTSTPRYLSHCKTDVQRKHARHPTGTTGSRNLEHEVKVPEVPEIPQRHPIIGQV
jgi:hypothetical protein